MLKFMHKFKPACAWNYNAKFTIQILQYRYVHYKSNIFWTLKTCVFEKQKVLFS